jgi:hypothetical protein
MTSGRIWRTRGGTHDLGGRRTRGRWDSARSGVTWASADWDGPLDPQWTRQARRGGVTWASADWDRPLDPQRGRPSMYGMSARTKSLSSPSAASANATSKASSADPAMPSA